MKNEITRKFKRDAQLLRAAPCITHKHIILGTAVFVGCVSLLFAQGFSGSSHHRNYDLKRPLPLALPDAYVLAATHIGTATNRLHCITASCLDTTNQLSTGWVFCFSNTNGEIANVKVFFNKDIWIDTNSSVLLK